MDTNVYRELPHIDQRTIECDLRAFTRWLNDLADIANWLQNEYPKLKAIVEDHEQRIKCLEERMDAVELRLDHLEECCEEVQQKIQDLQQQIDNLNQVINMMNNRLDWLFNHLPTVYGNVPEDWRFAMGNINVMSDNNGSPNIDGAGIFTSRSIEDNDIYFN